MRSNYVKKSEIKAAPPADKPTYNFLNDVFSPARRYRVSGENSLLSPFPSHQGNPVLYRTA